MLVHELTESECRALLKNASIGRLACAHKNQPYVVPIQVYPDGEYLYGFAMLGRKIEWMRENPKVCVQFDDIASRFEWTTIVVFGRFEELVQLPDSEAEAIRRRAHELFRQRPEWWQPASSTIAPRGVRMPVIYRIRITEITGRRTERPTTEPSRTPWWLDVIFKPQEARRKDL